MLNMGPRVSEVSNLKPGDINLTEGKLRIINGKGGIDRDLIIPNGYTSEILKKWKSIKPKGEYFFTTLKGGKVSTRYIHLFVKIYAFKSGIDKNVSPHTLRHYVECYVMVSEKSPAFLFPAFSWLFQMPGGDSFQMKYGPDLG